MRRPPRTPIDSTLRRALPAIERTLGAVSGSLLDRAVQAEIDERLAGFEEWNVWIDRTRRPLGVEPWSVGPGFPITAASLIGLSRALFPGFEISPYEIGPEAVTEVSARVGATARSHSQNDLPAQPHTAGFFDVEPPSIAVFGCVRPHPGGGAETTVTDVERILADLPCGLRRELAERQLTYETSDRLGRRRVPFRVLTERHSLPFVRFRMDRTVDRTPALAALDSLIRGDDHRFVASLAAGEVLFVWNGAPHGRLPQLGPTPVEPMARRQLLRCRLRRA